MTIDRTPFQLLCHLGFGIFTIGLAEACLVTMGWIPSDFLNVAEQQFLVIIDLGRDGVVVCRVSWVGQAEVASNGATLGKMNMKNKVTKRTKPCMEHIKEHY